MKVLASSEKAYWKAWAAARLLEVRAEQHRIATENLRQVERRFEEGLTPRVEIFRSEVGVYKRLESLIVAENQWRLAQRALKAFLATEAFPIRGKQVIEIATAPRLQSLTLDRDALLERALAERVELIELELAYIRTGLQRGFAENQILPIVNLDFQYGTLARDDSLGEAFGAQWDLDNQDVYVGLSFEVPFTNQQRRARLDTALLAQTQVLASREARELQVRREVLDMADIIDRNWQRILAARQNVIVAGVNYEAERQQFAQGRRTQREVLEALSELGSAQVREVKAIIDYQIAQIDLAFASGTLLGYARVDLDPLMLQ